jgi:hypothetical protein
VFDARVGRRNTFVLPYKPELDSEQEQRYRFFHYEDVIVDDVKKKEVQDGCTSWFNDLIQIAKLRASESSNDPGKDAPMIDNPKVGTINADLRSVTVFGTEDSEAGSYSGQTGNDPTCSDGTGDSILEEGSIISSRPASQGSHGSNGRARLIEYLRRHMD